jgi:hypothetical protein
MAYLTPRQRREQSNKNTEQGAVNSDTKYLTPRQRRALEQSGASSVSPKKPAKSPMLKKSANTLEGAMEQARQKNYSGKLDMSDFSGKSSGIIQDNPVVWKKPFVTSPVPIKKLDPLPVKLLKSVPNFAASVFAAPGEALRHTSIQASNTIQGKPFKDIPKETSFTKDILPSGASKALDNLQQKHPIAGGLVRMGLETGADPTSYIGAGTIKNVKMGTAEKVMQNTVNQNTKIVNSLKPKTVAKTSTKLSEDLPSPASKIVTNKKAEPFTFKAAWDKLNKAYTRVVDTAHPFRKTDEETYRLATNSKSTGGIVDHILTNELVDKNGIKVGESFKKTVEAIPKGKEEDFWTYMSQRHNIDRAREGKALQPNYTQEMSAKAVAQFEAANPGYKKIGDSITGWIDNFMTKWGVDAGIVDKEVYSKLRETYKSYFPTQREFSELEKSINGGAKRKYIDLDTPIKKAVESERDIKNPIENIMNLVNRTVRTAKYNEVGKSLLDSVRKAPDKLKDLAEVIPTQEGMFANTDNVVSILENGKPTYLRINNKDLLDALNGLPKNTTNIKGLSNATNIFKSLITQKNPIFAIRNIARDLPTAYINGTEKNPIKFGRDLVSAGKDLLTNSKAAQQYKGVGGGGANFFNSGNPAKSAAQLNGGGIKSIIRKPLDAIEKFNNLTETAPRLAEFKRVTKKTGDVQKGLYAANDVTTNFSRGGDITKALDRNGVAYLNAGVQGLDKLVRQVATKPLQTLAKGAVAITAPTLILDHINKNNPAYKDLDQRTKDNYYLFPLPNGTFFKLPKAREYGVLLSTLEQRIARAVTGDKEAFKGLGKTVETNFSPTNPLESNMLSPIISNLPSNKDFAGRAIVPQGMLMDGRSKYLQYDEKTSTPSKWLAQQAKNRGIDLSPKQIDYIVKSYTGVIGQIGLPAATNNGGTSLQKAVKPITSQFTADPLYSNQVLTDFYDNFDKLKQKAADKNITQKIASKLVTPEEAIKNKFNKASLEISDKNKEIRALNQVKDNLKIRKLRQDIINIAKSTNEMLK